jgi:hypothetical protein
MKIAILLKREKQMTRQDKQEHFLTKNLFMLLDKKRESERRRDKEEDSYRHS